MFFRWYTNSFLASIVSILGYTLAFSGISGLFAGAVLPGLLLMAAGIPFIMHAATISKRKAFKTWLKGAQEENVDGLIRESTDGAIRAYNLAPGKDMLKYIRGINPEAANVIAEKLAANK